MMYRQVQPSLEGLVHRLDRNKSFLLLTTLIVLATVILPLVPLSSTAYAHRIAVGTPPRATRSLYMGTIDATNGGLCSQAGQTQGNLSTSNGPSDGVTILAFGAQVYRPSQGGWGTLLPGTTVFVSNSQIEACVQQYIQGYYYRTPSVNPPQLDVLVGTNNSTTSDTVDPYLAGGDWGVLINRIANWVYAQSWLAAYIKVASANDMETSTHTGDWHDASWTRIWMQGYVRTAGHVNYDFGDAAGCYPAPGTTNPPTDVCDYNPNNPSQVYWRQQDKWYVARGAGMARAIPEIYYGGAYTTPSDVQARQWQKISLYGYTLYNSIAGKVVFGGSLTQWNACNQRGGCAAGYNTPEAGWTQLMEQLNNMDPAYHGYANPPSTCTAPPGCHRTDQHVGWSSDIMWYPR